MTSKTVVEQSDASSATSEETAADVVLEEPQVDEAGNKTLLPSTLCYIYLIILFFSIDSDKSPLAVGPLQETHHTISHAKFIKDVLNEDDTAFHTVQKVAEKVVKNPEYRESHQAYLNAIHGVPGAPRIDKSLMTLYNSITEVAPKCNLETPYPLNIEYTIQRPRIKGDPPSCAALLQEERLSSEGGWPVIVIHTQKPITTPLDTPDPTPEGKLSSIILTDHSCAVLNKISMVRER